VRRVEQRGGGAKERQKAKVKSRASKNPCQKEGITGLQSREYVRELIRQDQERRMANLEQELLAAARGPKIEVSIAEIRKKGLITALRERVRTR
jgi:hypothetical protein